MPSKLCRTLWCSHESSVKLCNSNNNSNNSNNNDNDNDNNINMTEGNGDGDGTGNRLVMVRVVMKIAIILMTVMMMMVVMVVMMMIMTMSFIDVSISGLFRKQLTSLFMFLSLVYCKTQLRPSLDIVLSPHRTQFHLARCLARSKHGCDLDTAPN